MRIVGDPEPASGWQTSTPTDLGEAKSRRKKTLRVGDSKWTRQRAERRVKPKEGTVPVPCPIDSCTKVYHWDKELVAKLPQD
eukprot:14303314-Ditylum_brightwellii.AAC.1